MVTFRFADDSDREALRRFSQRLGSARWASWPLTSPDLPGACGSDDFPVRRRRLVAEEDGEIRAIQNFFEHQLYVDGKVYPFVWPNGPVSEAVVDPKYAALWMALLRYGLSVQPLQLILGAFRPGHFPPLKQFFAALRWPGQNVPAFAYPIDLGRICRQGKSLLHNRRLMVVAALLAGYTGLGTLASVGLRVKTALKPPQAITVEEPDEFGRWADVIWEHARAQYRVLTRRDAATLNRLYRPADRTVRRLRIRRAGRDIGWILLAVRSFVHDARYGSLRVAALADGLGELNDVPDLIATGLREAVRSGADLCMAWWTHKAWQAASGGLGFMRVAPGDMTLYVAPMGTPRLLTGDLPLKVCHFSRGDCDGPRRFMDSEGVAARPLPSTELAADSAL